MREKLMLTWLIFHKTTANNRSEIGIDYLVYTLQEATERTNMIKSIKFLVKLQKSFKKKFTLKLTELNNCNALLST